MAFFVRALKLIIALLLLAAVVLWFAARRGDRGYISEQVTIDRPAPVVYRWIVTDDLLRRWMSDIINFERISPGGAIFQVGSIYRIDEMIAKRPVALRIRIIRAVPNQDLELSVRSAAETADGFSGDVEFKLLPNGDYTQLVFTSQTNFQSLSDQMFEPILTFAVQKKVQEDLTRLKFMVEAEPASR